MTVISRVLEDLERSEQFCKKIREAVGVRADLLFGTHGQFTVSGARAHGASAWRRMIRLWFEEPTTPENPADMAEIARSHLDPYRGRRAPLHQAGVRAADRDWAARRSSR